MYLFLKVFLNLKNNCRIQIFFDYVVIRLSFYYQYNYYFVLLLKHICVNAIYLF